MVTKVYITATKTVKSDNVMHICQYAFFYLSIRYSIIRTFL